jgi:predicted TIM-barrel fold metal-dependent hydrolase
MDVIHCAGAEKLIYGLDFPWNTARTNRQDIEIIRSMAIPEDQKTAILGGNLLALLNQEADRAG